MTFTDTNWLAAMFFTSVVYTFRDCFEPPAAPAAAPEDAPPSPPSTPESH